MKVPLFSIIALFVIISSSVFSQLTDSLFVEVVVLPKSTLRLEPDYKCPVSDTTKHRISTIANRFDGNFVYVRIDSSWYYVTKFQIEDYNETVYDKLYEFQTIRFEKTKEESRLYFTKRLTEEYSRVSKEINLKSKPSDIDQLFNRRKAIKPQQEFEPTLDYWERTKLDSTKIYTVDFWPEKNNSVKMDYNPDLEFFQLDFSDFFKYNGELDDLVYSNKSTYIKTYNAETMLRVKFKVAQYKEKIYKLLPKNSKADFWDTSGNKFSALNQINVPIKDAKNVKKEIAIRIGFSLTSYIELFTLNDSSTPSLTEPYDIKTEIFNIYCKIHSIVIYNYRTKNIYYAFFPVED